jgi:2'-5' RNA ligase
MKLFSEYLKLVESSEKKKGTYSSFQLDEPSRKKLHDWLESNKIENLVDPDEYHITVTYSRKPVPEINEIKPKLPIKVKAIGWEVFDNLLVLKVSPSKLKKVYDESLELGATSDYDSYIPHISVAKKFKGEVPETFPKFTITLNEFIVDELDLDFSYSMDDE